MLTAHGLDSFDAEYERALVREIEGVSVRILPLERIIASKRATRRPKDRAERPAPFDGSLGSGGVSILWIDDDVRDGDRLLLKMLGGFAVDAAKTAAEGLALALTRDYGAIVVDCGYRT